MVKITAFNIKLLLVSSSRIYTLLDMEVISTLLTFILQLESHASPQHADQVKIAKMKHIR